MPRSKKFSSLGKIVDPREPFITKKRIIKKIIFHCSANSWGTNHGAKYIDRVHLQRFGKNSGCGYHWIIMTDGTVQKGRWADSQGAHAKDNNSDSLGIVYMGGLDKFGKQMVQGMNEAQYRTAKTLAKALLKGHKLKPKDILGHNELPFVNKGCPCTPMEMFRSYL